MLLDAIALLSLILAAGLGWRMGAMAPLLQLAAAVVCVLAAPGLGPALDPAMTWVLPEATTATRALVSALLAAFLLYALLALGIGLGVRLVRSGGCLIRLADGFAGMLFAGVRTVLLLGLALWLIHQWSLTPPPDDEAPFMTQLRSQAGASFLVRTISVIPVAPALQMLTRDEEWPATRMRVACQTFSDRRARGMIWGEPREWPGDAPASECTTIEMVFAGAASLPPPAGETRDENLSP